MVDCHSQKSCIPTTSTSWRTMSLCSTCTERSLDATPTLWVDSVCRSPLSLEVLCNRQADTALHLLYSFGIDVLSGKLNMDPFLKQPPLWRQTDTRPLGTTDWIQMPFLTSHVISHPHNDDAMHTYWCLAFNIWISKQLTKALHTLRTLPSCR